MEAFPEKILRLWNKCEVRVIILLSLFLQIILVTLGSRRKFTARSWYRIVVWLAYLTTDWVAAVALGNLAASTQADSDLQIFWAPFLLLHMGGPDTITAYSLEDNEWLRHLLGLVVHVGVAFYVFLRSWGNSALTFIAIPIFITGIMKYGERTFVLRSSSAQRFKNSLLSNPDPGPNIIQMRRTEERSKQQRRDLLSICGFSISFSEEFVDDVMFTSAVPKPATVVERESLETGASDLPVAYFLFKRFRYLFADSILGTHERIDSCSLIENKSAEGAFKVIATELGFMYDLLYTKATIVYSRLGIFFRVVSFIASITGLVLFSVIIDIHAYSSIDVSITYVLLIGAVVLEVYAFCVLLFSDWTALWYAGVRKTNCSSMCCATFPFHSILANRKRWSRSMAQYNLVSSCLQQQRWFEVQKLPWIGDLLEKYQCLSWEDVDKDIEEMIFRQLVEKKYITKSKACKDLLEVNFGPAEEAKKGDKSQSLLFYGCRLAQQLKSLENDNHPNKWEVISEVWVEMLTYASNKCKWKEHGQQLRKGGELLTHVRLLMVHLGLSEQYRIQKIKFNEENVRYLKPRGFLLWFFKVVCLPIIISLIIIYRFYNSFLFSKKISREHTLSLSGFSVSQSVDSRESPAPSAKRIVLLCFV